MARPAPIMPKPDSLSGNTLRNFENELAALAPVSDALPALARICSTLSSARHDLALFMQSGHMSPGTCLSPPHPPNTLAACGHSAAI